MSKSSNTKLPKPIRYINDWYFDGQPTKFYAKEIESGGFKRSRYLILFFTFLVVLFLGHSAAFSAYGEFMAQTAKKTDNPSIKDIEEYDRFTPAMLAALGVLNVFTYPLLARFGPRVLLGIGAAGFILGNIFTGVGVLIDSYWVTFVAVVLGVGIAEAYAFICPVIVMQAYFPDKRGLAVVVSSGGYACGSFLGTYVHVAILKSDALKQKAWIFFVIIAIVYGGYMSLISPIYKLPPADYNPAIGCNKRKPSASSSASCHDKEMQIQATSNVGSGGDGGAGKGGTSAGNDNDNDSVCAPAKSKNTVIVERKIDELYPSAQKAIFNINFLLIALLFCLMTTSYITLSLTISSSISKFGSIYDKKSSGSDAPSTLGDTNNPSKSDSPSGAGNESSPSVAPGGGSDSGKNAFWEIFGSKPTLLAMIGGFNLVGRLVSGFSFDFLIKSPGTHSPLFFVLTNIANLVASICFYIACLNNNFPAYVFAIILAGFTYGTSYGPLAGILVAIFNSTYLSQAFSFLFAPWAFFLLAMVNGVPKLSDSSKSDMVGLVKTAYLCIGLSAVGIAFSIVIYVMLFNRNKRFLS